VKHTGQLFYVQEGRGLPMPTSRILNVYISHIQGQCIAEYCRHQKMYYTVLEIRLCSTLWGKPQRNKRGEFIHSK